MSLELSEAQRAIVALWQRVNTSLSAYHKLVTHFGSAHAALHASSHAWQQLHIHSSHVKRHQEAHTSAFIDEVQDALNKEQYRLLFIDDAAYPRQLKQIYDPPPVLFYKGNVERLHQPQLAIVGSRKPSTHAQKTTFDMAQYLAQAGYVITSGLAVGVDIRAHLGALAQHEPQYQGRTVGVMGTGINVCYPSHHDRLVKQIVESGGVVISELLPNAPPNKHTFPRRNRLVAGLAQATIVTEAACKSGSLITARLSNEQGKQVFAVPSHIDNVNAEGCHHLIREGATLIYHPQHIIEDLQTQYHPPQAVTRQAAVPTAVVATTTPPAVALPTTDTHVPEHLTALYAHIDWHGQDLDALVVATELAPPTLIGLLMELELLGMIQTQGGRYSRV
ncbi:DNA-processing protein DprA [Psychrobacter aestuarii]|uniref:DNA-processing protein DprA n=1 Tax=Psychrobacter aestuarii TaxID=556327 RepID=A0ABP3FS23_9GAMM|nr:DNA-processing protein DprA [Psychrobacter aestuarii]